LASAAYDELPRTARRGTAAARPYTIVKREARGHTSARMDRRLAKTWGTRKSVAIQSDGRTGNLAIIELRWIQAVVTGAVPSGTPTHNTILPAPRGMLQCRGPIAILIAMGSHK